MTRRGHVYTPRKTKDFEASIKAMATLQMHEKKHKPLGGPLSVKAYFYLKQPKSKKSGETPCKKPDLDNLGKSLFDALNGVAWDDDGQICLCVMSKNYATRPSITIFIKQLME